MVGCSQIYKSQNGQRIKVACFSGLLLCCSYLRSCQATGSEAAAVTLVDLADQIVRHTQSCSLLTAASSVSTTVRQLEAGLRPVELP